MAESSTDNQNTRFLMGPSKNRKPTIDAHTKLLCFDIESNGLHGQEFAVGAVVMGVDETIVSEFRGGCPIRGAVDPWVEENVLPMLADYPKNYPNSKALREGFWQWYMSVERDVDYVIVNNGYPVEYRFLIKCQADDIEPRYWQHPFPILDLGSLLIQVGVKPLTNKPDFVAEKITEVPAEQHNPYWDAWVSALAAFKALKLSGQLKG